MVATSGRERGSRPGGTASRARLAVATVLMAAGVGVLAATWSPDSDTEAHGGDVTTDPTTVPASPPRESSQDHPRTAPSPSPSRITIPAIEVRAPVMQLGLESEGTLEVPPMDRAGTVGWYRQSPAPGRRGPSVLVGHVDSHTGPAVFHRLGSLRPGTRIVVGRRGAGPVTFVVDRVEQVAKDTFPTQEVYGDVPDPQLRLITCGGEYEDEDGGYQENVVVFASLAEPG